MLFLLARLQSGLLQCAEIHQNPSCLSKLCYIYYIANNCDINSMGFYFAFRALSKGNVQWYADLYQLSGFMLSNINLQIGQYIFKVLSSLWGSSLCVLESPEWNMQQNWDSPSILFNRKRIRLKENRALYPQCISCTVLWLCSYCRIESDFHFYCLAFAPEYSHCQSSLWSV